MLFFLFFVPALSLNIGLMYSGQGIFAPYGLSVPVVTNYWLSHRPLNTSLIPYFCDVKSNSSLVPPCLNYLLSNNVSIIVGPETFLTNALMPLVPSSVTVISGMAATPDIFISQGKRKYNNLFGVMTPSFYYFKQLIPYFYIYNLRKIGIISSTGTPDSYVCQGAYDTIKDYDQLEISYYGTFTQEEDMYKHINNIKELDVLIFCHRLGCSNSINALNQTTIKALAMFECGNFISDLEANTLENGKFIYTPLQWDYRLRGTDFTDPPWLLFPNNSAQSFYATISPLVSSFNSLVPSQMACLYVIEDALRRCPTCSNFVDTIASTYLRSFYGIIRFNDMGLNDGREMVVVQLDRNYVNQVIIPITSATSKPIIPMPMWHERVYNPSLYLHPLEIVYYIYLSLFTIGTISLFILGCYYREHPRLKSLSLRFLLLSLLGMWMWTFAPLTWKPREEDENVCSFRLILWTIPPIVYIIPFAVKTVRIYRIFNSSVFTIKKMTDLKLGQWTLLASCPFIILSCLGTVLVSSYYDINDINRPSTKELHCYLPSSFLYFYIFFIYLLLLLTTYLAYCIRKANQDYNDSRTMGYLFYNLSFIFSICLACHLALDSPTTLYGIRIFALIFHCVTTVILYIDRVMTEQSVENSNSSIVVSEARKGEEGMMLTRRGVTLTVDSPPGTVKDGI